MRTCPQCHLLLEQIEWETPALWVCRSCGGCWFPASTLDDALTTRRSKLAELDTLWPGISAAGMFEGLRLSCPECPLRTLELEPLPAAGNINILRCRNCRGTWLLAGERTKLSGPETVTLLATPVTTPNPEPAPSAPEASPQPAPVSSATGPVTVTTLPTPEPKAQEQPSPAKDSDIALARLLEGNRRYADGTSQHIGQTISRRAEVSEGQQPFAIVVGCSDSRVPPEIVFDQGLGDLFVVRTAGGTYGKLASDGIAYAAERFNVPLILVVGHEGCSAVRAALDDSSSHPYLAELVRQIRPAVERARSLPGDLYENAVKENVHRVVETFAWDSHLQPMIANGKLSIVGAYYDLHTGLIEVLEDRLTIATDAPQAEEEPSPEESAPVEAPPPAIVAAPLDKTIETNTTATGAYRGLVPVESLPPVIESTEEEPGYTPPEPQIGATAPVYRMAESKPPTYVSRWCPQCRKGFPDSAAMCPECGVGLVLSQYCIRCLECGKENRISADHCWSCLAPLHSMKDGRSFNDPANITSEWSSPPTPYDVRRTGSKPSSSCITSLLTMTGLFVMGAAAVAGLLIVVLK
jgi:carbonic anhydrase